MSLAGSGAYRDPPGWLGARTSQPLEGTCAGLDREAPWGARTQSRRERARRATQGTRRGGGEIPGQDPQASRAGGSSRRWGCAAPRIAEIREQMEAELTLAALRKRGKQSQAAVAKRLAVEHLTARAERRPEALHRRQLHRCVRRRARDGRRVRRREDQDLGQSPPDPACVGATSDRSAGRASGNARARVNPD